MKAIPEPFYLSYSFFQVQKLAIIFAPLFFAIIGAQVVDLTGINVSVLYLAGIMVAIGVASKLAGCSVPSMIFLKDGARMMKVAA